MIRQFETGVYERRVLAVHPIWEVDTDGRVYTTVRSNRYKPGDELIGCVDDSGYVRIGRNTKRAKLICTEFHGPRPSPKHEVAHRNDVKTDDRPANLYWATRQENANDALKNGKYLRGEQHPVSKWTDDDVREMRALYADNCCTLTELMDIYGDLCRSTTELIPILIGAHWKHIVVDQEQHEKILAALRRDRRRGFLINEGDVREIRALRENAWTIKALATKFGVSEPTISGICNRKRWVNIA